MINEDFNIIQTEIMINNKPVKINVFDYDYYHNYFLKNNFENEGHDIISNCIEKSKVWAPLQTELTIELLKGGNNLFIDIGCHIGYYSLIAHALGNKVISIDKNDKYLNLLRMTINKNNIENIDVKTISIDDINSKKQVLNKGKIKLLKISMNGNELTAYNIYKKMFRSKKIENALIAIYPKLNSGYIFMCKLLHKYGYKIYNLGISPQRTLDINTNHLKELGKYQVRIENIKNIITNLEYNESIFLFKL